MGPPGYSAPAMIKVLVAAVLGTVVGIAVMVIVIVTSGTTTENASSIGLSSLPVTSATPGGGSSTSTTPSSSGGGSTSTGGGSGNAANGKTIFTGSGGCGSCHAFTAAGTTGSVGPNLDSLAASAQQAGQPLDQFVLTSIVDPNKFIAQGFSPNIMPQTFKSTLSQSDLNDLVAFITQNQK